MSMVSSGAKTDRRSEIVEVKGSVRYVGAQEDSTVVETLNATETAVNLSLALQEARHLQMDRDSAAGKLEIAQLAHRTQMRHVDRLHLRLLDMLKDIGK